MAENKRRNSVEEQRAVQRELIEMKRQKEVFQENPDEFEHQGGGEAVAQTTKSKLENFWYYSRFTIIGLLILAIIIGIGISSCVGKIDYDMTIVMYTKTYISSAMSENIASIAERYCSDYNGDGKVEVLVVNCSIPDDQRLTDTDGTTRLLGQFQNEEAITYIVDKAAFEDLDTSFGEDFLYSGLGLPDLGGRAFKLNGTVFDMAINKVSEGYTNNFDYYILRRNVGKSATADKKDVKKHIRYSENLIQAIVADPTLKDITSSNAEGEN